MKWVAKVRTFVMSGVKCHSVYNTILILRVPVISCTMYVCSYLRTLRWVILMLQVDSQFNFPAIHPWHNNRNSEDHRILAHKLWSVDKTPIKLHVLQTHLSCYPDKQIAMKLSLGFSQGFHLHYRGPRVKMEF
jgi:hypothetical protein